MKAAISLSVALVLTALGAVFPGSLGRVFLGPAHLLVWASARIDLFGSIANALRLTEWNWVFTALNALLIWAALYLISRRARRAASSEVGEEGAA